MGIRTVVTPMSCVPKKSVRVIDIVLATALFLAPCAADEYVAPANNIARLSALMADREAAVERMAITAENSLSSTRRCESINQGLRDPREPEVPCSVPQCGERLSDALPEYICDPTWGTTGIGGCFPTCTDELGSSASNCKCAPASLHFAQQRATLMRRPC